MKKARIGFVGCVIILLILPAIGLSQLSNTSTYKFLSLTQSSRTTALGGGLISVLDGDVALSYANPALINAKMHGRISFNHNFHFADIQHGFINYGIHSKKWKTSFHAGLNYISYGEFVQTDQFGNQISTFDAGEIAIAIGAARQLDERIRAGINLKFLNSNLDTYGSFGIIGDFGLYYHNPDKLFSVGLVLKNTGLQLSTYTEQRSTTPIDLQLGFSKKFEHLPFRFSMVAHKLLHWNIRFDAQFQDDISIFGETPATQSTLGIAIDNLFRHLIFNGEFLIGTNENFKIRFGYNHLRRKELSVSQFRSLAGFSLGFGLQIKKISFDYGLGYYHLAGAVNHLGISINLRAFRNKI